MEKLAKVRGFRPHLKVAERFDYAGKLGINISEYLTELVDSPFGKKLLDQKIEQRKSELREVLEAPHP